MGDTLYLDQLCPLARFLIIILKFTESKMKVIAINELSEVEQKDILHFSPTKQFPLLKSGEFLISGTLPILRYIISSDEKVTNLLFSTDAKSIGWLEMWLNYALMNLAPICAEITSQLLGKKDFNKGILDQAIADLMDELSKVNDYLKFKTFFYGHSIKLPDLLLACLLFDVYNTALLKDNRDKIPNVIRHFLFIANLDKVKQLYSTPLKECKEITALPFVPKEETKKELKEKGNQDIQSEGKKDKKEKKEGQKVHQEKGKNQKENQPKEEAKP